MDDLGQAADSVSSSTTHAYAPAADNVSAADVVEPTAARTCEQWSALFEALNHYFRDEDILAGSEHATVQVSDVQYVAR